VEKKNENEPPTMAKMSIGSIRRLLHLAETLVAIRTKNKMKKQ